MNKKQIRHVKKVGYRFLYVFELYKRLVIERSRELSEYKMLLGYGCLISDIVESFFYGYDEWLAIIPVLNHPDSLGVVEIYRAVLRSLLENIDIRPDFNNWYKANEFQWSCIYLWSRAPLIQGSFNLNHVEYPLIINPLTFDVLIELNSHIPKKRRGKYSACPYHNQEKTIKCHFNSITCAYSESTKYRCYPLAGLHACNGHGSKCLLNRGKKTSLERLFKTTNGVQYPNLRYLEDKYNQGAINEDECLLFNLIPQNIKDEQFYKDLMSVKGLNENLIDYDTFLFDIYDCNNKMIPQIIEFREFNPPFSGDSGTSDSNSL